MPRLFSLVLLVVIGATSASNRSGSVRVSEQTVGSPAVFVAYYWRAKPGQGGAYGDYIKTVAEPIDMDAKKAGAFEDVWTVMPATGTTADWTHLRIFRVKDAAAAEALGRALDAATARIVPDEAKRKANSERASGLREFVRQEAWTELR